MTIKGDGMSEKFSFSSYEEFIYKRTYARWVDSLNRREYFDETVDRYKGFYIPKLPVAAVDGFTEAMEAVRRFDVMPSMRAFFSAGPALERDHIASYNCAGIAIDSLKSFSDLLYILMNGSGVGFTVERQVINKLPVVANEIVRVDNPIVFADSKRGWAEGLDKYIRSLYKGENPGFDLSKIRAKGEKLKVFGGRASGPQPLKELLNKIRIIINNACGRKLNSIEVHDICCYIESAVIVGGVRRSSGASFSNLSDERMKNAKSGEFWLMNPQRSLANNSVAYTEKPDTVTFLSEWRSLIKSRTGERGIFNREGCNLLVAKNGRRTQGYEWISNPCARGDMRLLTVDGYKTFESLCDTYPYIINSSGNVVKSHVWCSGEKSTVSVRASNGIELIGCTPDHVLRLNDGTECMAGSSQGKKLMPYLIEYTPMDKNAFTAGFLLGDGNLTCERVNSMSLNLSKNDTDVARFICVEYDISACTYKSERFKTIANEYGLCRVKKPYIYLPKFSADCDIPSFLCGLYSANGSVLSSKHTIRVTYKTASAQLANELKDVLESVFNIKAYITTNKSKVVTFRNGDYVCKESYDVNIANWSSIKKFYENINFLQGYKRDKLKNAIIAHSPTVKSVLPNGKCKVYDFTEPITNWGVVEGFVFHNCFEIILRPSEFCNLSEVIVRPYDTEETLLEKIKHATIIGAVQATLTDFKFISKDFKKNCEDERLLGVSLTGLRDHPILGRVSDEAKELLSKMREKAIEVARIWSELLGINMPAAITCVKPSGTVSQMVDTSSGMHTRFSKYYIRRVRVTATDSLCKFLIDSKIPHNPEVGEDVNKPNTYVFEFPVKAPDTSITNKDVSALEQLEYQKMLQEFYTEHKVSCTVFVRDSEWIAVGAWVYDNWDIVTGISFLPLDNNIYPLAPYEEITECEYNKLKADMPVIDFKLFEEYEIEDQTIGAQEFACSGGSCELK